MQVTIKTTVKFCLSPKDHSCDTHTCSLSPVGHLHYTSMEQSPQHKGEPNHCRVYVGIRGN